MFAALSGAAFFLALATFSSMPVSTTHAAVGGVVGMTLVGTNPSCLNWSFDGGLGAIVVSWVTSPVLSGLIAICIITLTDRLLLQSKHPVQRTLRSVPVMYAFTTAIVVVMIMLKSPPTKALALWVQVVAGVGAGIAVGFGVRAWVVPLISQEIDAATAAGAAGAATPSPATADGAAAAAAAGGVVGGDSSSSSTPNALHSHGGGGGGGGGGGSPSPSKRSPAGKGEGASPRAGQSADSDGSDSLRLGSNKLGEPLTSDAPPACDPAAAATGERLEAGHAPLAPLGPEGLAKLCFRNLLVFVAVLKSFAHGANDTANATGAFTAVVEAWRDGLYNCEAEATPSWVMACAGAFVFVGMYLLGKNVIRTIGSEIGFIDFHRGFCIELVRTARAAPGGEWCGARVAVCYSVCRRVVTRVPVLGFRFQPRVSEWACSLLL
jgi:sodium-dependent phosphate transporter